jgi:hypothetical protein
MWMKGFIASGIGVDGVLNFLGENRRKLLLLLLVIGFGYFWRGECLVAVGLISDLLYW